jgi:hypothetical protein
MPAYEIYYLKPNGVLGAALSATCRDDKEAKILAHAMKLAATRRIEVWDGERLVYERPETPPARSKLAFAEVVRP